MATGFKLNILSAIKACYTKLMKTIYFVFCVIVLLQISAFSQKMADLTGTKYCKNKEMANLLNSEDALFADRIVVQKKYKKLYLLKNGAIAKSYDIAMGPGANLGPKAFEGDNKTPEGIYNVEFKNPKSRYYMALKVSYPNIKDMDYAKSQNKMNRIKNK